MAETSHQDYPTHDELGGIGGGDYGEDASRATARLVYGIIIVVGTAAWVWFNILQPLLLFFFGWAPILFRWSDPRLSFVSIDTVAKIRGAACLRAVSFIVLLVMANLVFVHKQPWLDYALLALGSLWLFGFFSYVQHDGPTYGKPPEPTGTVQSASEQVDSDAAVQVLTGVPVIAIIFLAALWGIAEAGARLVLNVHYLLS